MNKAEILESIKVEHDTLVALIAPLSEDQLCSPTFDEGWSIKDIIAHITVWEGLCTDWLETFLQGEIPDPLSIMNDETSNNRIFHENQNRSLQEIQEDFHHIYQTFFIQVQEFTQTLSVEDLNKPLIWLNKHSFIELIANNSYEHYQDHEQQISTWLNKTKR